MRDLIILILILSFQVYFGQNSKPTIFGLKGGLNFSDVVGKETNGSKTGYKGTELYGGFFADTKISEKWNFESELLFSYTDDYHFIEIPLHMKYNFAQKWNFLFGPKFDFPTDPDDIFYEFNSFGVSLEAGIQYHFGKRLFAEGRYAFGIKKFITDRALDINNATRNTLRFGLGLKF